MVVPWPRLSPDVALGESTQTTLPDAATTWSIADGTAVGRFLVIATVGRGATGVVVAAWDGELGRKVAIKFLAAEVTEQRARVRAEAQALARLAHPHVIRIHDVGEHDGRLYMVMEYVDGDTLVGVRAAGREGLAPWIAAGRGLAAAHAAGLVHGDFKPANVLLGVDGRARVSDFGHAAIEGEVRQGAAPMGDLSTGGGSIETSTDDIATTRSGALVGTPAYMAPEVFAGAPADARADQFSYCVALYEALWGTRPFAGSNVARLAAAVTAGELRSPPTIGVVPLRVRRAVLRGLSRAPSARFPSMNALLAELERDPWRWPQRLVPAAIVAALPWMASRIAADDPEQGRDYCGEVERRADALWNEDRAKAIDAAFSATLAPFAADEFTRARAMVDEHAAALREAERSTCEMVAAGTLAVADAGSRQLCLHLAHQQLAGLLDLFERADAALVEHASEAASRLPAVEACTSESWGPPVDPARRDEIYALGAEVARARVAADAWRDGVAVEAADRAAARAVELDAPWLAADAHAIAARVLERDGDATAAMPRFDAAFAAALASDNHAVAVIAALGLAVLMSERGDHDDALRWIDHAAAALGRASSDQAFLASAVLNSRGQIAYHHGDFAEAKRIFSELLTADRVRQPGTSDGVGSTMLNIGLSDANLGHVDAAIVSLREALAIEIEDHGENHPALLRPLNAICHVEIDRGETALAIEACQRAIDVARASRPGAQPRLSHFYTNLGSAWFHAGSPDQAEAAHLAALDNAMRTQPDDDLLVATIANNLGVLYDHLERVDDAARYYGLVYDRVRRGFGPDHPSTALVGTNLAMVRVKQGDFAGARALLDDGLEHMAARLGPDHPDLALGHAELGRIAAKQGDHVRAVPLFRRAFALRIEHGGDDIELADTSWGLAISLAELHGRTAEVDALADRAHALYTKAGGDWAARAAEVTAWRAGLVR
jgi:tetratricopeptide (TPR) repeat protein